MNIDNRSNDSKSPLAKKLHLHREVLRTLTGSERLLIAPQGRSMRPECLTSTVPTVPTF
jgi:hypothetical protein